MAQDDNERELNSPKFNIRVPYPDSFGLEEVQIVHKYRSTDEEPELLSVDHHLRNSRWAFNSREMGGFAASVRLASQGPGGVWSRWYWPYTVLGQQQQQQQQTATMSTDSHSVPLPPQFPNSELNIPPFLRSQHPYTKWMVNMMRSGSHYRLTTMVRERPELFQQIFQVPDQPHFVGSDARDTQSMFHSNAVLYLNPLCLAIYLKDEKSVELMLRSGVNHAYSRCYATDVFSRGVNGGDLVEILPICVAVRREFYDAIPALTSVLPPFLTDAVSTAFDIGKPIELRYESKTNRKSFRFRDTLHYATEVMKKRLSINISSLLETLISIKPEIWQPQVLEDDGLGQKISLFRRVARIAYYDDPGCRKSHNLISALELLFRNRCFVELQPTPETKAGFEARIQSLDPMILDQDCCIALLLGLYYRMHCKVKNGPMNAVADIIRRALAATRWRKTFLRLPVQHLQKIFSCLPENVALPADSLMAIKTHINIINEREQDNAISLTGGNRIPARELRSTTDDCSLLRASQPNKFSRPPSLTSYIQASSAGLGSEGQNGVESEAGDDAAGNPQLSTYSPASRSEDLSSFDQELMKHMCSRQEMEVGGDGSDVGQLLP